MKLSIVIPVYNSSSIIENLSSDILAVSKDLSKISDIELILVNDCSTDDTWLKISKISDNNKEKIIGINLMKNYGQHNAIMAGLKIAKGDYILLMDDDYQHPPKEISKILNKILEGYDVCYTNYKNNTYSNFKLLGSWLNKKISNILIDKPKSLYLSSFKCFTKKVCKEIVKYDGPFVYIDGLIFDITKNVASVDIEHSERKEGKTNYNIFKLISLWLRVLTNFSIVPLRLATFVGFFMTFISFIIVIVIMFVKINNPGIAAGWASLSMLIVFFSGIQLILIGLVGEYIGRSYIKLNKKPQFIVREYCNFSDQDEK
jgi:undecaprenyl-phosphate 4-deoxy-4-formamido-L-arabinose transferase